MKNLLSKSLVVFVVMSLLNAQLSAWSLRLINELRRGMGMLPIAIFLECLIVSIICFVVILLFKKNYDSILKIATLFEIIYFLTLIILGANPISYFTEGNENALIDLLLYLNSFVVFLLIFLVHLFYSKIISPKK
jgi:hypothetical protein